MSTPAITDTSVEPDPQSLARPVQPFQTWWLWIVCLLGVDYFSTLAYQPSLALQAAGRLAPLGTVVVVLATLLCALPVYWYIAGKSPYGNGSIVLIEQLVQGWRGKTLILLLLGFAATDFVMIKTISLADAAEHVLHNSWIEESGILQHAAGQAWEYGDDYLASEYRSFFNDQLIVTLVLTVLGFIFWYLLRKGFTRNVVVLAVPLVGLYLLLNAIIIGCGLVYLVQHPQRLADWVVALQQGEWEVPRAHGSFSTWLMLGLVSLLLLPQLSLGLSGFEMSLLLMPQVKGSQDDDPLHPRGRIHNTRRLLTVAAIIMACYLLGSALVTSLFIPADAYARSGAADNRALAYLAHGGLVDEGPGPEKLAPFFGPKFGTLYDLITILILGLAGTSVMTALAGLLPQFLLRFGMELPSMHRWGVLLVLFALVNVVVTIYFQASVQDQRGAYATSVLVLMTSGALVTCLSRRKPGPRPWWRRLPWRYTFIAALFGLTTLAVMFMAPTGLLISFSFILVILTSSVFARALRSDELRTTGFDFVDEQSKFLWDSIRDADIPVLVPHRPGLREREKKEETIRADHDLAPETDIVFIEVEVDDPSNFYQRLLIHIFRDEQRIVIKVTRCTSVAHAIASIALEISRASTKPPAIHFGWTEMDLLAASWHYFAFGEGNIPAKVRELIHAAEPNAERQPRVVIG